MSQILVQVDATGVVSDELRNELAGVLAGQDEFLLEHRLDGEALGLHDLARGHVAGRFIARTASPTPHRSRPEGTP